MPSRLLEEVAGAICLRNVLGGLRRNLLSASARLHRNWSALRQLRGEEDRAGAELEPVQVVDEGVEQVHCR
eukprot:535808-Pyramimonas_sp.AAC.1